MPLHFFIRKKSAQMSQSGLQDAKFPQNCLKIVIFRTFDVSRKSFLGIFRAFDVSGKSFLGHMNCSAPGAFIRMNTVDECH